MVGSFKVDPSLKDAVKSKIEKKLTSTNGTNLANSLLNSLRIEKDEGETKRDFQDRVLKNTLYLLDLET